VQGRTSLSVDVESQEFDCDDPITRPFFVAPRSPPLCRGRLRRPRHSTPVVKVFDRVPDGWRVTTSVGAAGSFDAETVVTFDGTVTADEVADDGEVTLSYFAYGPGADDTGRDAFGPACAEVDGMGRDAFDPACAEVVEPLVPGNHDGGLNGDEQGPVGGMDTYVVGADTSMYRRPSAVRCTHLLITSARSDAYDIP